MKLSLVIIGIQKYNKNSNGTKPEWKEIVKKINMKNRVKHCNCFSELLSVF